MASNKNIGMHYRKKQIAKRKANGKTTYSPKRNNVPHSTVAKIFSNPNNQFYGYGILDRILKNSSDERQKIFKIWTSIISECYGPNPSGNTIWESWQYFSEFEKWAVTQLYETGLLTPVNGHYSPSTSHFI